MEQEVDIIALRPAQCSVDLNDGSERGEYVNQDYILNKLGRPHRAIGLMYCYYPLDATWPQRAREAFSKQQISFQWDYPYDDYFPYTGGITGDTSGPIFEQMRDIRKHGQDIVLTLSIDPTLPDEYLIGIVKDLKPFGHLQLRINHETSGNWFCFTKRVSYSELANFFVRFHNIVKQEAPNIETIFCTGGVENPAINEIEREQDLCSAVKAADIFSVDKYLSLHWGWPYDIAEEGGATFVRYSVQDVYNFAKRSEKRFRELCNFHHKPMYLSELNADGDVTGPFEQAKMLQDFCNLIKQDPEQGWLTGFTLYQFRDRGRLGLEKEDENNCNVGIEQPILTTYKNIIHDPYFSPQIDTICSGTLPISLEWISSEDATGIGILVDLQKTPTFCEIAFEEPLNLMIEFNGRWFYKSPTTNSIDLMPAFYEHPIKSHKEIRLNIFAPPTTGENVIDENNPNFPWRDVFRTRITKMPQLRIRYSSIA